MARKHPVRPDDIGRRLPGARIALQARDKAGKFVKTGTDPAAEAILIQARQVQQGQWLHNYGRVGTITGACELTRVNRATYKHWLATDPAFADLVPDAWEEYLDRLEQEATRRGVAGVRRPVLYRGKQVLIERRDPATGQVVLGADGHAILDPLWEHEYSDQLLVFKLRGERPGKYGRIEVEHGGPGGGPIPVDLHAGVLVVEVTADVLRRLPAALVDGLMAASSSGLQA